MLRISYYTLGCKLNQSETETALASLAILGYEIVDWSSGADIYLINTCTVTAKSEQKARRLIRQAGRQHSRALIVVCGCYAVVEPETLAALGNRVVVFSRPQEFADKLAALGAIGSVDEILFLLNPDAKATVDNIASDFPFVIPSTPFRQRYFFKIQDGCDRTCSFCRIRIARGRSRSLAISEIIPRLQQLANAGYREIVITGVHINSYQSGNDRLGELLATIIAETEGFRLRLSSLEPEKLTPALANALAHQRICPHFHLSLQSGSAHVLRQMRRAYSPAMIERFADALRQLQPDPFFSADVIVGFPGESESDFENSLAVLQRVNLADCHGFSYSSRPETAAALMPTQVPATVKQQRMTRLQQLTEQQKQRYLSRQHGRKVKMLLESWEDGYWIGASENYLRPSLADPQKNYQTGELVDAVLVVDQQAATDSQVIAKPLPN